MTKKVLIIGGGASGLAAAITCAGNGNDVTVIEKNDRVGKKLLTTGNGRCNFGNLGLHEHSYNNDKFVSDVLLRAKEGASKLMSDIGLMSYADDEGRLYPVSETATSVLDCLRFECEKRGVKFVLGKSCDAVYKRDNCYAVMLGGRENMVADNVIIAVGGKAQTSSYNLDKLVEHRVLIEFNPSLVPVKVYPQPKAISGLRVKGDVTLYKNGEVLHKESGEVLFKDNALSGIVIMNMSAFIARDYLEPGEYEIEIDAYPYLSEDELLKLLKERYTAFGAKRLMTGMFHSRIADEFKRRAIANGRNDITGVADAVKHMRFKVTGLGSFAEAQVMTGGIDTKALRTTLEFRKNEGLYACGEAVDIDGLCGGYNLHWAFSSGIVAGMLE